MRWLVSFYVLALLGLVHALSSSGNRLLVVIEEAEQRENFSQLWGDLEGMLTLLTSTKYADIFILKDEATSLRLTPRNAKISRYFDMGSECSIISYSYPLSLKVMSGFFFTKTWLTELTGLGPSLTPNILLQFINQKGNILLALSGDSPTSTAIASLLLELDIHLPPDRASIAIDNFNYDVLSATERHDVLLSPQPAALRPDLKNFFAGQGLIALPRAVPQELGNFSPHLAPILRAKSTAYSYNPKNEAETVEDPFLVGEQISLVSSMQARNSARFTVLGSVEALEDKWFDATVKVLGNKESKTANREFAKQVTAWTFLETGVLKVGKVEHHLSSIGEGASVNANVAQLGYLNPKIYRIKNDVVSRSLR